MATISVRCQNDDGKQEIYTFTNSWIKDGLNEKSIDFANFFAKEILAPNKERISTSQFRNIYGELKRIQLKGLQTERTSFHLLLPKIAYAVKRNETNGGRKFNDL